MAASSGLLVCPGPCRQPSRCLCQGVLCFIGKALSRQAGRKRLSGLGEMIACLEHQGEGFLEEVAFAWVLRANSVSLGIG